MSRQLRDPAKLAEYLKKRDRTQAQLGRLAGCERAFIHKLLTGIKRSCTDQLADAIERELGVDPGTLFLPPTSRAAGSRIKRPGRAA